MNISSETFPTKESHFYNGTAHEINLAKTSVGTIIILLAVPIHSYVIWLIARGTGNGLAAEIFSLNYSICEMFFYLDCLLNAFSYVDGDVWRAASFFSVLALTGRPLFQCLICVERYLAVVHPVTFLKYKPLKYRLICCVFVWVAIFVSGGIFIVSLYMSFYTCITMSIMVHFFLCLFIQLYLLVAVLRALKQSGPGDRKKEQENHIKGRAFQIILITTLSMLTIIVVQLISMSFVKDDLEMFVGIVSYALAGLVQPILVLYRIEKMHFIKC